MKTQRARCVLIILMVLGATPSVGNAAKTLKFNAKNKSCVAKTWDGTKWVPVDRAILAGRPVTRVEAFKKEMTRFRVDSKWYVASSRCIQTAKPKPEQASELVADQVEPAAKPAEQPRDGLVVRAALEYGNFRRTLGFGGTNYRVSLSTIAAKAGFGQRKFFESSSFYWGWNIDAFFGVSKVEVESGAPFAYSGTGVFTAGSRASGAIGSRLSNRIDSQLDLGAGLSYASMKETGVAGATNPKSVMVFPLLKLGFVYQTDSKLGFGVEAMSQGILRDYAFSGGVQWVF